MTGVRARTRAGGDSLFAVPGFAAVYSVGVVWSLCRWAIGFLGAYVVAEATGSPRLVQLTGAMLWAPLLVAGVVGGALSDRAPRRLLLLIQFGVLGPLTVVVGLASLADRLPLWALYGYMLTAGMGWVIDMTVRRALVYDLVGDHHVNRAMAFEGLASSVGLAGGALAGGTLIGTIGAPGAYLVVAAAIGVAAALLILVPSGPPTPATTITAPVQASSGRPSPRPSPEAVAESPPATEGRGSLATEVRAGLSLVGRWPVLASVLGVTALTNFFHFSYFPIVPVIADLLAASPQATGALAAATGLGMAVGSTVVLRFPGRRGVAYIVGSAGAFVFLLGFAAFDSYWPVFASLFVASSFVGMFGATQSALVMTSVGPEVRGRAMGLLSMAIGMLPLGMAALGEMAEVFGPRPALIVSNVVGLIGLALFLWRRPEALRVR
ncbi:MAG: MFS transporter [Acidimicrobiales bacterium]